MAGQSKRKRSFKLNLGQWAIKKLRRSSDNASDKENVCVLYIEHSTWAPIDYISYQYQEFPKPSHPKKSIRQRAASIVSTISSVFSRSRASSPAEERVTAGTRHIPPEWLFTTQFVVDVGKEGGNATESFAGGTDISTRERHSPRIEEEQDEHWDTMARMPVVTQHLIEDELDGIEDVPRERVCQHSTASRSPTEKAATVTDGPQDVPEDDEEAGDSDREGEGNAQDDEKQPRWLPTVEAAQIAHKQLDGILNPRQDNGIGHKDPKLDLLLRSRLEAMKRFLWAYTDPTSQYYDKWMPASLATAKASERGPWFARRLREWSSAFIIDPEVLPENTYGTWNNSRLDDEDMKQDLNEHLQTLGKFFSAMDIVRYLDKPEVRERYKMKKGITERTAQRWLKKMGYRWKLEPSGQYVDGHEREDVTTYRQKVFLPRWKELEARMRNWKTDGQAEEYTGPRPQNRRVIAWFHDESTFYAHDRRKRRWCHETETAVPWKKGEGASLMVADFVSAEFGWLRSPDGTESARVYFKAGKTRDGYFTAESIQAQTEKAMDLLQKWYPEFEHVFIFDNATTHLKRPDTAPSARKMTKGHSETFGVDVNVEVDGKPVYLPNGKPKKMRVKMGPGRFADGTVHVFYDAANWFKGMTGLLMERGLTDEAKLNTQCKDFKCAPGATACYQRRVLYNQPDFAIQESVLETRCNARGFEVLFLPKFHCELNFIEQCWGHAKRVYRQYPPSSKEADLEANVVTALESVPVVTMRR
ncbi:hypothetical protein LshimejAT787_2200220 [Lyophyllum shimeji]|uniref:Uncharacterized protein n=1 Tax=Lyophyllum shimeji TaxID=47721 RepID=A0A9P3Q1I4_LYOSH|nr:hypothetical protein LshimejAT787_2200220 [Lyophyllum shimeji]